MQRPQVKDFPGGIHTRAPPPGHTRDNADEQVLRPERVAKGVSLTLNVGQSGGIEQWQARFGVFEMTTRFEGIGAEFDLKESLIAYELARQIYLSFIQIGAELIELLTIL
ncbi:hypothetical protein B0H13DRAFT_1850788 [Mycena leptocephala]|nr:hypothetical protein B0H13DRAFT_1850788 [Mycena leptocephala]